MLPEAHVLRKALVLVLQDNPEGLDTKKIDQLVALHLGLSNEETSQIRTGNRTEFAYRMAWERTHAKAKGEIIRVGSGHWKISTNNLNV